jgi:hypothetical protein
MNSVAAHVSENLKNAFQQIACEAKCRQAMAEFCDLTLVAIQT